MVRLADFFDNDFCTIVNDNAVTEHFAAPLDDEGNSKRSSPQPYVNMSPVIPEHPVPSPKLARHLLVPATTPSDGSTSGWTVTDVVMELPTVWTPKALEAVALKDYTRKDPGEIDLRVGDLVKVIEKVGNSSYYYAPMYKQSTDVSVKVNDGWWRGVCNGKCGTFPAKHVELRGRQE